MTETALITGGTGRIGRALASALMKRGVIVRILDRKEARIGNAKVIVGELTSEKVLSDALRGVDVVYHLAASIDYGANNVKMYRRNVVPTEFLLKHCDGVKQFIFMSSTSVYGESKTPIRESDSLNPKNAYGHSKVACEKAVISSGIPYTIIRSSQVFGPQFHEGFAYILKRLKNRNLPIFGAGDSIVPMVYIDDLVQALLLVRNNKKAINQIFNVDSAYNKTQLEFFTVAAKVLEVPPPSEHKNLALVKALATMTGRGADVRAYVDKLSRNRPIGVEKIKKLGFKPSKDLEQGIREVVQQFEKEGRLK